MRSLLRMTCAVFVSLALSSMAQVAAQTLVGEIAGRVTDSGDETLPGVRLQLSSGALSRETLTDRDGRFRFDGLPSGTYRVVADLAGFRPVTGDITISSDTPRAFLAWSLEIGCLTEVLIVVAPDPRMPLDPSMQWVHVRVDRVVGPTLLSVDGFCEAAVLQEYAVEILGSVPVRAPSSRGAQRLFTRSTTLVPGQEFITVIWRGEVVWDELVMPISSGRVVFPRTRELNGKTPAQALQVLAKWARKRRKG